MDNRILGASSIALVALLAACGGGGATPQVLRSLPPATPTTAPTTAPTSTPNANTTTATGLVVNDANALPLAGQRVVLMPFGPCGATPAPTSITPESDGCPTPLPSPQVTTAPNGTFSLGGVPNGHYLLIIGNDSTSTTGTITATIHDNVTLTGGAQTLKAPTLPANPMVTRPAWEANGDYRIATLNTMTEVPCFQAWQTERAANNLAASSVDEWLLENVRFLVAGVLDENTVFGNDTITVSNTGALSGTTCAAFINLVFGLPAGDFPAVRDPRTLWFGGQFTLVANGAVPVVSFFEFPIDPRSFTDPVLTWL
jgi:hypothetical protein